MVDPIRPPVDQEDWTPFRDACMFLGKRVDELEALAAEGHFAVKYEKGGKLVAIDTSDMQAYLLANS